MSRRADAIRTEICHLIGMMLYNYLRTKKWSSALKTGIPTSKATSLQVDDEVLMYLGDWNTVRQKKKESSQKVTSGDTEYFTLMNADTVPKLPKLHSLVYFWRYSCYVLSKRGPHPKKPTTICLSGMVFPQRHDDDSWSQDTLGWQTGVDDSAGRNWMTTAALRAISSQ